MVKVTIPDGVLEGELLDNILGGKYCSFKGIPYAAPPVGDLRFKAPQPPKPWQGVRPAKSHGPICHQINIFTNTVVEGSEDCLYLNVYTPTINPIKPLPVIFYIHGGGFMSYSGNSDIIGPDFILKKDVVLVTINYRLEVLGFLCLNTKEVPGNAGMKDQVAALRWVNKNIRYFGGDPENVTICGQSAGGASVAFHLVSPMSKDLFKRAIVMSGVINCSWATSFEPRLRAESLAAQLGTHTKDDKELYEFFKMAPVDKLIGIHAPLTLSELYGTTTSVIFSVVNEKQFDGQETFFSGNVNDILRYNNIHKGVEILTGYTTSEGYLGFSFIKNLLYKFNHLYEAFLPIELARQCSDPDRLLIGRKVKEFYFGQKEITRDNINEIVNFISSSIINYPLYLWAKSYSYQNRLFYYKFDGYSERNMFAKVFDQENLINHEKRIVTHCDELTYLLNMQGIPLEKDSNSLKIIDNITTLFTNFAKTGNPTPADNECNLKWPVFDTNKQYYAQIDDTLTIKSHPDKEEFEFWDEIYRKYYPKGYIV